MSFVCKYCEKEFTLQGNLLKHQKTTKYCIKIQKEKCESINNDIIEMNTNISKLMQNMPPSHLFLVEKELKKITY